MRNELVRRATAKRVASVPVGIILARKGLFESFSQKIFSKIGENILDHRIILDRTMRGVNAV